MTRPGPPAGGRPNVVLVCVDQMRADAMGADGNADIDTPYLDDLARRGYRFRRGYSATPTCVPARVAMLTGKSPAEHGRYGYREGVNFPAAYPVTLPSVLRESGYQTFAVGKMHVFPDRARCGFDEVLLHDGFLHYSRALTGGVSASVDDYVDFLRRETGDPRADYQDTGLGCNAMVARPWEREERLHPTRWVADESFRFLQRRDPTRPFFLYMSFHRPHAPFDPPAWLWEKYRSRRFAPRPRGEWVTRFESAKKNGAVEAEFADRPESTHHAVKAGYYGNIEFIDLQINRLQEALSDHGLSDTTIIVFVSDHGDMMGDHDMYRKSVAYEGSARIPFLVYLPPGLRDTWGEVREPTAIVELRDVMPTILEIAGIQSPSGVDGLSVRGATHGAPGRDYLHGEHLISSLGRHSMQWIRGPRFTYIWFSGDGHEQLFDMDNDPQQLTDLAALPEYAGTLEDHRRLLIAELSGREEGFVDAGALVPGRPVQSEAAWVRAFFA